MSWVKCPTCPRSYAAGTDCATGRCYWCRNGLELLGTIQRGGVFVAIEQRTRPFCASEFCPLDDTDERPDDWCDLYEASEIRFRCTDTCGMACPGAIPTEEMVDAPTRPQCQRCLNPIDDCDCPTAGARTQRRRTQ